MGWFKNMIQTWLEIKPKNPQNYVIYENKDFKTLCAINRLWLRGDSYELQEIYKQLDGYNHTFWGSVPSSGMEIKKSHSGLPALIINKLTDIVVSDFNGIECDNPVMLEYWNKVSEENNFDDILNDCISDTIGIGDGAIRYSYDKDISEYPILEWFPSENVDFIYKRGKLIEIDFYLFLEENKKVYKLIEKRGYGFINYELYDGEKLIPLNSIEKLSKLKNITFNNKIILATPLIVKKSKRYKGRGSSLLEGKYDSFDSLDEVISQWIEAIRTGRAKTYIPENLCPRDENTGEILQPNAFDRKFILSGKDMSEGAQNKIQTEQPEIPTSNYLESYITYLGLCMQGLISPSTLGIDNKKIQDSNASYERQMEKTTMFTRSCIINAVSVFISKVVNTTWIFSKILSKEEIPTFEKVSAKFGEFNSPSFDAQIETMAKARTSNILSIEAMIEELYGDSKTEEWKQEEILRIKNEMGVNIVEEPSVNQDGFNLNENPDEMSPDDE